MKWKNGFVLFCFHQRHEQKPNHHHWGKSMWQPMQFNSNVSSHFLCFLFVFPLRKRWGNMKWSQSRHTTYGLITHLITHSAFFQLPRLHMGWMKLSFRLEWEVVSSNYPLQSLDERSLSLSICNWVQLTGQEQDINEIDRKYMLCNLIAPFPVLLCHFLSSHNPLILPQ